MTRDEVLEAAANITDQLAGADLGAMLRRADLIRMPNTTATERHGVGADVVRLVCAVNHLQAERDALKAQLEATERRAKEALARVEALTAEVKHREWVENGAPMLGEVRACVHGVADGQYCDPCHRGVWYR